MSWLSGGLKSLGAKFGLGSKKVDPVEIKSPYETGSYQQYKKKLQDMLAKRDVYSPEFMSSVTNPYATTARTNLKDVTTPMISAQASARGLGRSTIPVNRISKASQGVEQSIAEKMAQLSLANEQEKLNRESFAIGELKNEALGRTDVENQRISENARAQGEWEKNQSAGVGRLATLGVRAAGAALAPVTGGASLLISEGIAKGIEGTDTNTLQELLNYVQNSGKVNVAKPQGRI